MLKENEVKEGNIIFLSKREFKLWNPFSWVSNIIALFQGKATHTATVFKRGNSYWVREMSAEGTVFTPYWRYMQEYGDRVIAIKGIGKYLKENVSKFNSECNSHKVTYDFKNLIIRQPLRILFGIKTDKESIESRICSEDTARCINILKHTFDDVENISPQEMLDKLNG